jgi:hypothetical protein
MRVCKEQERSRRMHWGGANDRPVMAGEQLHAERGTAMVERCLARSRAMGWQWQSRLLQGVVVVASQGLLPQEGHQVAKLECTKASSKLQHGPPHSNLLATVFHLIHHCSKIGIFHYIIPKNMLLNRISRSFTQCIHCSKKLVHFYMVYWP